MTEVLFLVYVTFVGGAIGSFLNVCIYRWPEGESVIRPRSRCPSCGHRIRWWENVPVLSWVGLRGRCSECGARISIQYPIIELTTALLWLGLGLHFGPSLEAVRGGVFFSILLGIAIIDGRHQIIPDQLSLGGAAAGLLFAAWPGGFAVVDALIGGVGAYAFMWLIKWAGEKALGKPALGVGDIHMMAMIGAFTGIVGAILTLMLGSFLGLALGVPIAAVRGNLTVKGTYLPLGTFLAMGAAITYAWGDALIGWYLGMVV